MASDAVSAFDVALASLTFFEETFEGVEILSAALDQKYDEDGALVDCVDIGFRIVGRPGMFQVTPELDINWQAQAFVALRSKHVDVEGIYAGLASKRDLPVGPTGGPSPLPGQEVAA